MAELPYMPVLVQRLLADTNHLSPELMGAYTRLLLTMWASGGRLVDDEAELRTITGLSAQKFRKYREKIFRFFVRSDGFISQKRLTDTLLKVREDRVRKAQGAAKTNAKRWGSLSDTLSDRNQNKKKQDLLSSEPMTPDEYVRFRQTHAPLGPVELRRRGNR